MHNMKKLQEYMKSFATIIFSHISNLKNIDLLNYKNIIRNVRNMIDDCHQSYKIIEFLTIKYQHM